MKYHLTPRLLTALAVTAAMALTGVAPAQFGTGGNDDRDALSRRLTQAQNSLNLTARRLLAAEFMIERARFDVDRLAVELAEGRDPKEVADALQKVQVNVDRAQKAVTGVEKRLVGLLDEFTKIRIAASTQDAPAIALQAARGIRRVQSLQERAKIDQVKIGKLNLDIQTLLAMTRG